MTDTNPEMRGFQPTEYFDISTAHPELRGGKTLEILNLEEPTTFVPAGTSQVETGRGDIKIQNISDEGIVKVRELIESIGNMDEVRRILTAANFITWDKPSTGR